MASKCSRAFSRSVKIGFVRSTVAGMAYLLRPNIPYRLCSVKVIIPLQGRGEALPCSGGHRSQRVRRRAGAGDWRRVETIEATAIRIGLEHAGDADDGFGRAERQHAVGLEHFCDPPKDVGLGVLVEIDQIG